MGKNSKETQRALNKIEVLNRISRTRMNGYNLSKFLFTSQHLNKILKDWENKGYIVGSWADGRSKTFVMTDKGSRALAWLNSGKEFVDFLAFG